MSDILYLEHLSDADVRLLARLSGVTAPAFLERARAEQGHVESALADPRAFDLLFHRSEDEALLIASPFLTFAVLLQRAARELENTQFVEEWIGPHRTVPTFAVQPLRDFVADDSRRRFLAEVLASYTRVASGVRWVHGAHGWRKQRFSDLDPARLLDLVASVPSDQRGDVYRRLGDLALFLTGVFPDFAHRELAQPVRQRRVLRALHNAGLLAANSLDAPERLLSVGLLEAIGSRSYHAAWQATAPYSGDNSLADMSTRFGDARRVLNFLSARYLFHYRENWFSPTA